MNELRTAAAVLAVLSLGQVGLLSDALARTLRERQLAQERTTVLAEPDIQFFNGVEHAPFMQKEFLYLILPKTESCSGLLTNGSFAATYSFLPKIDLLPASRDLIALRPIHHVQKWQSFTLSPEVLDYHRHTAFHLHITSDMRCQENSWVFPEWALRRWRLLYQHIQYGTSHLACIQRIKQILLNYVGATPYIDESSAMRQEIKPRRIEYAVSFGS